MCYNGGYMYHESEVEVLVFRSCLTLCDPMNCSPPGSSVQELLQARILEWVAMPSSGGSSQPRDQTQVSCMAGGFFNTLAIREAHESLLVVKDQLGWIYFVSM